MRRSASVVRGDGRHVQVVELAARVRPTCRFVDAASVAQGVEAGVSVSLMHALELSEVRLWMDTFSVW
jgi:hypothetical protein